MIRIRPLVLVALAASGCAFVSESEMLEFEESLDTDLDGWLDTVDCDVINPDIHPVEVDDEGNVLESETGDQIADGIDNDCSGADLLDGDGDDYPVISRDDYRVIWQAANPNLPAENFLWPDGLATRVDCDDADGTVHPGATDTPYDGVDSDCGCAQENERGCEEFDRDGDGQFASVVTPALVEAYMAAYPFYQVDAADLSLYGDCNDLNADIFVGADDVYYDGVDTDCDGGNDFDQDGDGFIEDRYAGPFATFVDATYAGEAPLSWNPPGYGSVQTGDCLDMLPEGWTSADPLGLIGLDTLDPATVNPGATDVLGDGIDSDCQGDNDFDGDLDGVTGADYELELIQAFVDAWSGYNPGVDNSINFPDTLAYFQLATGDCDDLRADVNPFQVEALFDTENDRDCDGSPTTAAFAYGGYLWHNVYRPRAVVTDGAFVFGAPAYHAYPPRAGGGWNDWDFPLYGFHFDRLDGSYLKTASVENNVVGEGFMTGPLFDLVADGDTVHAATTTTLRDGQGNLLYRVILGSLDADDPTTTTYVTTQLDTPLDIGLFRALDLHQDPVTGALTVAMVGGDLMYDVDGELVTETSCVDEGLTCTDGLGMVEGTCTGGVCRLDSAPRFVFASATAITHNTAVMGTYDICLLEEDGSAAVFCGDTGDCQTIDQVAGLGGPTGYDAKELDRKDGLLVRVPHGANGFEITDGPTPVVYFPGQNVLSADAVRADTDGDGAYDRLFVGAVVDDGVDHELHLAHAPLNADGSLPADADLVRQTLSTYDPDDALETCVDAVQPCATQPGRHIRPDRVELAASTTRLLVLYTGTGPTSVVPPTPVDAIGWSFLSYHPDADGDGYPDDPDGLLDPSIADPDDTDPTVGAVSP